jgi:hypothetical protein
MIVEIDQSGKLEQLNTATVVAYANQKSGAVWIRAAVKRKIVTVLRERLQDRTVLWPMVFGVVVFLLIEELDPNVVVQIDEEYTGKNRIIAQTLAAQLNRRFLDRWRGSIRFGQIGKTSPAHRLAWQVHRSKNRQRVRSLREQEILRLLA